MMSGHDHKRTDEAYEARKTPVIKSSVALEPNTFVAEAPYILPEVEVYDPPRPIPDAKGSLSNAELREIAKKRVPPELWFEGEEEQVF